MADPLLRLNDKNVYNRVRPRARTLGRVQGLSECMIRSTIAAPPRFVSRPAKETKSPPLIELPPQTVYSSRCRNNMERQHIEKGEVRSLMCAEEIFANLSQSVPSSHSFLLEHMSMNGNFIDPDQDKPFDGVLQDFDGESVVSDQSETSSESSNEIVKDSTTNLARNFHVKYTFQEPVALAVNPSTQLFDDSPSTDMPDSDSIAHSSDGFEFHTLDVKGRSNQAVRFDADSNESIFTAGETWKNPKAFSTSPLLSFALEHVKRASQFDSVNAPQEMPEFVLGGFEDEGPFSPV